MVCSINLKKINSHSSILEVAQKIQNLTGFEILKLSTGHYYRCQILSFLHSPKYQRF
jgi:hypothetical protein